MVMKNIDWCQVMQLEPQSQLPFDDDVWKIELKRIHLKNDFRLV